MSIERRLFRLLLVMGLLCFAAFEAVSFLGLYDVERRALENSRDMGTSAAEFAESAADKQARERFALLAKEKAQRIEREMVRLREDTELLSQNMTHILTHRELYRPRRLPVGGEVPIASREPYLFFLPALRESGQIPAVLPDAEIAANGADILSLWAGSYESGYQATCFFLSELGYFISADVMPDDEEYVKFYDEWYTPSFDSRQRLWYEEARDTGKTVFTDVYVGVEGYPAVACIAPYYNEKGFAGVAGMSSNIDSLYQDIAKSELEGTNINFVLNTKGEVLISSEKGGLLAASETPADLRRGQEQELAAQAVRMVQGDSDVTLVTVADANLSHHAPAVGASVASRSCADTSASMRVAALAHPEASEGREYYLAYAPIPSLGWSFGTLIEKDLVAAPAQEARSHLLAQAETFGASLQEIFFSNLLRTAAVLLLLLAALYFASRRAADRFISPILTLRAGVRDIAEGNLDRKIDLRTGDEIGELADSFNDMTGKLKLYIKNLAETTAEKERIATELDLAARIQAGILPNDFPAQEGFDLFATMHPAKEVGGDFYDFFFLDDTRLLVTIGDVSDKGVPAALFMVRAKTVLGSSVLTAEKEGGTLADAVMMANDELCRNNEEGLFVTVFTAIIDLDARKVTYVNAGHNLPAIVSGKGEARCIPKGCDPMLAAMEGLSFEEKTCELAPGDALFLYTDGVTEAENPEEEMFSKERMLGTLGKFAGKSARSIVEGVLAEVQEHAAGRQSDDITMLCIRWREEV